VRGTLEIPVAEIEPTREAVLGSLGVPAHRPAGARVERLVEDAFAELRALAVPRAIFAGVRVEAFADVYEGEGENEERSPLAEIFPRADLLVLFAVTLGAPVSERITTLFREGRPALGATLDAVASEAAELAANRLDRVVLREALRQGRTDQGSTLLRYSPGYCGWDITGQRALFAALHPEEIGIRLNESCLMEPLKSISGVMVIGPAEIHEFDNDYPFCAECLTKDCRRRIRAIRREGDTHGGPE
jgi:hypothetical protein